VTDGRLQIVLRGPKTPEATALARALGRLRSLAGGNADVHETFGKPGEQAAAIDCAARAGPSSLLIVNVEPDGDLADVERLLAASRTRDGVFLMGDAEGAAAWTRVPATPDLAALLAATTMRMFDGAACDPLPRVEALLVRAEVLRNLGGLDPDLTGAGDLLDLALRSLDAGLAVEIVASAGATTARAPSLPEQLLRWRNAVLIAARRADTGASGSLLAWVAAQAFAAAWSAAGIDGDALGFGADWGHQARVDRLLGRTGVRRSESFWPRDEVGSLVPILGLDAALDALIARPPARPPTRMTARVVRDAASVETADTGFLEQRPAGRDAGARARDSACATADAEAPLLAERTQPAPAGTGTPFVSVIVVNWNGVQHLEACFTSLLASRYPADRLELICVDNGSTDGSRELLAERFPSVRLVALEHNRGFTGGNNAGVEAARGDVLAFFNNDMRVEPDAIGRLVDAIDAAHPCTAARVLSWDGRRIDFVRGTISFEARGFQEHYGEAVRPELSAAGESFFPNGGAFAVTRAAYDAAGGFDDRFFAYYEDVDLGWGIRLNGGHIRVVPEAIVYHRHGATSRQQPRGQKRFLMERNALWTAVKRYGEPAFRSAFGPMLLLPARRIAQECAFVRTSPAARALAPCCARIGGRRAGSTPAPPTGRAEVADVGGRAGFVRRIPLESLAAVGEAIRGLPAMAEARARVQAGRRVPDAEVLPRFGRAFESLSSRTSYRQAHDTLVEIAQLQHTFRQRTRVLVITHEPLRANLSGPGVRALELGRALAASCRVTVASPFPIERRDDRCRLAQYSFTAPQSMRALAEDADVLVVQGFTLARFPSLTSLPAQIVVDLYCPFTIEHLEMRTSALAAGAADAGTLAEIDADARQVLAAQNGQLAAGDFFICASERQRDFWIGALHTAGRVNAATYAADPTLRSLIDVVPFGVPDEPPPPVARPAIKGVLPGIAATDRVLLWAGSILDWQDPQLLVRAVASIAGSRPDVKLVFMGARHPNPDVPPMRAVAESTELARRLGVLDTHVFFNSWVPYGERHAWLLDADVGASTHRDHLETRLSYRTRMLDYIWAGLPIVCTQGDVFADLVASRGLGLTVPPGDDRALAAAIIRLLDDGDLRRTAITGLRSLAGDMRWSCVTDPLLRFCVEPADAADRAPGRRAVRARLERKFRVSKWLKRTALGLGVSEGSIETLKQSGAGRTLMTWRNRIAIARAQRGR
jgi:GT2 family glycosyltransferase/glycosyltransferase involved in cell wall biosynthesis